MVNLAVIGCGRWGPNHIRAFNSLRDARAVAAADTDPAQLARAAESFPGLRMEQDYRRLLDDAALDAVVVATPTRTHYQVTRDALESGKHVLCEKPLCATSAQAQELVELARSRGRVLMVGHVFLFNAGIVAAKALVDGGELGTLHYLAATRTNLGPIRSDVDATYDLATHDISIFNWLLSSAPETVSAIGGSFLQQGIADVVFITLRYPGNVLAHIHASWLNPKKVRQITIVGSKKMLTWDDLELNTPVAIYDKGANTTPAYSDYGEFLRVSMWEGDVRLPKINLEEPLKVQARAFLDAIRRGIVERSDGDFSVQVVRTLEAASASLARGGSPVQVGG